MTKKKKLDLKPIELSVPKANRMKKIYSLGKIPIIKQIYRKILYPNGVEDQTGTAIPINKSLGTFEDQLLPFKVTEYFINKAGTILLIDCPCRTAGQCKNHDISLGCTWMGRGAKHVDLSKWPGARLATKEEALERERLAYADGLVPHLGKLRSDAVNFKVTEYEHEFMNFCHCCSCCCVMSLAKYATHEELDVVKRLEGVSLEVNQEECVGCTKCFKVCIYGALKFDKKNNKTSINQKKCKGCGRCEMTCPNKAISISIDFSRLDEMFKRFDSRVDISG